MKTLLDLAIQQLAKMLLYPNSFLDKLGNLAQAVKQIAVSVQVSLIVLSVLLLSCFVAPAPAYAQDEVLSPRQVVEYALTLEKLEADFYRRAVAAAQNGGLAGAPQIAKNAIISYGEDEEQHVVDLSAVLLTLGGNPDSITIPVNPNYSAILNRDPFSNAADFLLAGQYVEDLGVAAYKGQVQNLLAAGEAGKTVLAGALEIHTVEARHAAGIRYLRQTLLGTNIRPWIRQSNEVIYPEERDDSPIPFRKKAFDGFATRDEVIALVSPILNP